MSTGSTRRTRMRVCYDPAMKKTSRRKKRMARAGLLLALAILITAAVYLATHAEDRAALRNTAGAALDSARNLANHALPGSAPSPDAVEVWFSPSNPSNPGGSDDRLVALLRNARMRIQAAFYDLELQPIADALIDRKRAGVNVALVSDSHYEDRAAMQSCIRAGIPVAFDKREPFMHNKFCVVDGAWVWTGSTNATYNCMYRNNNNAVLVASAELAQDYAAEFTEMFQDHRFGGRSPKKTPYPIVALGPITLECYFAPEDKPEPQIIAELNAAKATIDFMAFSFTSEPIAEAVAARRAQGVRVRGLFEARNAGSRHSRDEFLAERGAQVFLDKNPYNMHHKVFILDTQTVITGSYNFSRNAATQNDENVLIIHDAPIARRFTEEFERLIR